MSMFTFVPEESMPVHPAQVELAFKIASHMTAIQQDRSFSGAFGSGESRIDGRGLTRSEQTAYDAALEVLRLYMTGEHCFAPQAKQERP